MAGSAIKDKTVVVTGANRGLGLEATLHSFAHHLLCSQSSMHVCYLCIALGSYLFTAAMTTVGDTHLCTMTAQTVHQRPVLFCILL